MWALLSLSRIYVKLHRTAYCAICFSSCLTDSQYRVAGVWRKTELRKSACNLLRKYSVKSENVPSEYQVDQVNFAGQLRLSSNTCGIVQREQD